MGGGRPGGQDKGGGGLFERSVARHMVQVGRARGSYQLKTKELLFQELNANSIAWNTGVDPPTWRPLVSLTSMAIPAKYCHTT